MVPTKRVDASSLHGAILALGRTLSRRQLVTARLHALAVDARGALVGATLLLTAVVDVNDVKGVNVAWDVSEEGEGDVDEDVGAAAGGEEDAYRRDCERRGGSVSLEGWNSLSGGEGGFTYRGG